MKILVVGGAGFIGSHVVDLYINEGHDVVVVDDLSTGKLENINPKAHFYQLNICTDEIALKDLMLSENFDIINHHAAQKSVPASVEDPITDAQINIIGTLHLLRNSVECGVKKFIFASSGGVLAGNRIPSVEKDAPLLLSPYAISKFVVEKYLEFYRNQYDLTYTVLRYANVYGPRQLPQGECGVVSIFLENLLKGKSSKIYTFPDMLEGATRDYVYVRDVAEANLLALNLGDNQIFNIGTGIEITTEYLYKNVQSLLGKDIPIVIESERSGDLKRVALDCSHAMNQLGWKPYVDLFQGLKETINLSLF